MSDQVGYVILSVLFVHSFFVVYSSPLPVSRLVFRLALRRGTLGCMELIWAQPFDIYDGIIIPIFQDQNRKTLVNFSYKSAQMANSIHLNGFASNTGKNMTTSIKMGTLMDTMIWWDLWIA